MKLCIIVIGAIVAAAVLTALGALLLFAADPDLWYPDDAPDTAQEEHVPSD